MNDYEYGPKYPPGEPIYIEEIGWATVLSVTWEDEKWCYVVETEDKTEYEVKEWNILL